VWVLRRSLQAQDIDEDTLPVERQGRHFVEKGLAFLKAKHF
jgi:hypothetical protein